MAYIFPILWQSSRHDGLNCMDVKVGGLAIECLSHHPQFAGKVGGSILKVAGF